ncbi:MAG TPA: hypothetical protein DEQ80_00155 [Anaerolinea thermolimosa]|uniref:Uncharacterized protein n=1 Tax=Anaerolinea thermolimosa TaxID=229919 RepID=A0A3D1JF59_9CHLR|nr:hypothetical protein [Anaerolinea thermolimosa]GAP07434.1 hypothetical protein ATHL_02312 [Anaerolinea thermolimosa]HCE16246.1 hypothetical protein [Anaerolinea thermolimosa]
MRGTPVARSWVVWMRNGVIAVDWGDGVFVDILSNQFFEASQAEVSHRAPDADLDWLRSIGRVEDYDVNNVYFIQLPEPRRL